MYSRSIARVVARHHDISGMHARTTTHGGGTIT
jgi:hypothetical protein